MYAYDPILGYMATPCLKKKNTEILKKKNKTGKSYWSKHVQKISTTILDFLKRDHSFCKYHIKYNGNIRKWIK